MLSKTQSKYIRSLAIQKFREEAGTFLVEGEKMAKEWLSSNAEIEQIVVLESAYSAFADLCANRANARLALVSEQELKSLSNLQTPNKILLTVKMPTANPEQNVTKALALDGIQDPGNMGTILRTADWFGVNNVICSSDCVDVYNPKVVQAGMGAHLRVRTLKTDLPDFLSKTQVPVFAATLAGTPVSEQTSIDEGILVIGNEGRGVSDEVLSHCKQQLTIPRIGGAESLNAAVSAGILCAALFGHN